MPSIVFLECQEGFRFFDWSVVGFPYALVLFLVRNATLSARISRPRLVSLHHPGTVSVRPLDVPPSSPIACVLAVVGFRSMHVFIVTR